MKVVKNHKGCLTVLFCLTLLSNTFAQTMNLELNPFIPITVDTILEFASCSGPVTIEAGTNVSFTFGSDCRPDIRIDTEFPSAVGSNSSEIIIGSNPSHIFASEGQYYVFCNIGNAGKEVPTLCISVVAPAQSVPTMGEWGQVVLILLLHILGVTALTSRSREFGFSEIISPYQVI